MAQVTEARLERAEKLLNSILSEIEGNDSGDRTEDGETYYGPFSEGKMDREGEWGTDRHFVAWPNWEFIADQIRNYMEGGHS